MGIGGRGSPCEASHRMRLVSMSRLGGRDKSGGDFRVERLA